MILFTYHLVKLSYVSALRLIFFPIRSKEVPGLIHAECMSAMTLGSPIFSFSRILIRKVAVFAQWEDEEAVDKFLNQNTYGRHLAKGWHTRLVLTRKWGEISGFKFERSALQEEDSDDPVVAVTIARMKFPEIPRFIQWGRPVEKLVRDHPATTLSLAAIRFPRTVSTFSIWKSTKEMTDMVHGNSAVPRPERHAQAMKERERKDFHFEFTTLRFRPISEVGEWEGDKNFIPDRLKK